MTEHFVKYPNLPEGKVTLAAAGNCKEITEALEKEGIRTVSFSSDILPEETKRHSDMLICHLGGKYLFCEPDINADILKASGFSVLFSDRIKKKYPDDVKLNIAVSKSFYICNPKTADRLITAQLSAAKKKLYPVKQGYTKCSVCFVTENAVITEDPSIYDALTDTEIDVLLISQGDIYLSDEHSGFFGGSSGKISRDILAVTGELKFHRDGKAIRQFCEKHGVKIKELKKGRITDIGGILPLKENRIQLR